MTRTCLGLLQVWVRPQRESTWGRMPCSLALIAGSSRVCALRDEMDRAGSAVIAHLPLGPVDDW
jgi:hypothetical protein